MSRGAPRTEPEGSPLSAFELLLASALQAYETSGEAGLAALCADHPAMADRLRTEIARLHAAGLAGTLAPVPVPAPRAAVPSRVGAYEIVRRLGAGGMGEVYLAQQTSPIQRNVALKIVRDGFDDATARARFLVERQALSRMQHDGIARVFEAGETDAGVPYFTMEYVQGETLAKYCDQRTLPLAARIDILCRVCDAVQHAHRAGVIHRDLKPENVLVVERDGVAAPKVIDFGLARSLDVHAEGRLTQSGIALGTLEYMSPEQARAIDAEVDTRTDVYGLGAMLYEQLTGFRPLAADRASPLEFLQRLRDSDPPPPSERVRREDATLAATRRQHGKASLERALRGDLDWITLRALAKAPNARYASPADLADDLRRHLTSHPVQARPPSAVDTLRKFTRRHRLGVTVAAVAVTLAAVSLGRELINLRELRERDTSYDRLALGPRVLQLTDRANELLQPPPGGRHDLAALTAWTREARAVLTEQHDAVAPLQASMLEGLSAPRALWLQQSLDLLRAQVAKFTGPEGALDRVQRRLAWAQAVEQVTLIDAAPAWRDAIAAIARCAAYDGLALTPQLGLVPLRQDPASGLFEFRFWHPDGEAARWGPDGRLLNPGTCDLVFVLLPGGTYRMGSEDGDPYAEDNEKPRHEVALDPFFLSKYEVTRGQWLRWTGQRPSSQALAQTRHALDDAHPASNISRTLAVREAWDWGLGLPTEAQWEYAARAGTTTTWWTGSEPSSLSGKVNLADAATRRGRVPAMWVHQDLEDGYPMTAPVDALPANAFGLHHCLGNVWEWCSGDYAPGYAGVRHRRGDGFIEHEIKGRERVTRGGSYLSTWQGARCALRLLRHVDTAGPEVGLRPSRVVVRPNAKETR